MTWACHYCGHPNLMEYSHCSRCGRPRNGRSMRRFGKVKYLR